MPSFSSSSSAESPPEDARSLPMRWNSPLTIVLVIVALHAAAIALILSPLTDLVGDTVYEGNLQSAAVFLSVTEGGVAAMQFFTDPIWGHISDWTSVGRKPPLLLAVFQLGVEVLAIYLWPTWWTLVLVSAARGLCGVGFTICSILLMDLAGETTLGPRLMGMYGAASGLGFLSGALSGVLLAARFDVSLPFLIAFVVEVVNGVWILAMLPSDNFPPLTDADLRQEDEEDDEDEGDEEEEKKSQVVQKVAPSSSHSLHSSSATPSPHSLSPFAPLQILFSTPSLPWLSLAFFLAFLARSYAKILFVWTKYHFGWYAPENGLFLAFLGLLAIVVQGGLMRHVLQFAGEEHALFCALALNLIAAVGYAFLPAGTEGAYGLYALSIGTCLSFLFLPLVRAQMSREVAAHRQGLLGGAVASIVTGASLAGACVFGPLFAMFTGQQQVDHHGKPPPPPPPTIWRIPQSGIEFPGAPFLASAFILLCTFPAVAKAMRVRARQRCDDDLRRRLALEKHRTASGNWIAAAEKLGYQEEDALIATNQESGTPPHQHLVQKKMTVTESRLPLR